MDCVDSGLGVPWDGPQKPIAKYTCYMMLKLLMGFNGIILWYQHISTTPTLNKIWAVEVQDQTKWLAFRRIHSFKIPDPTNGQAVFEVEHRYASKSETFTGKEGAKQEHTAIWHIPLGFRFSESQESKIKIKQRGWQVLKLGPPWRFPLSLGLLY